MSLPVSQIVYSSFPKVGFKSLASSTVSQEIKQAFLEQVVYQHWNDYNPPPSDFRAVYLYQLSPADTLFGWLYSDLTDDQGRGNTPYFHSYYTSQRMNQSQLQVILTCLGLGPLTVIEQSPIPTVLDSLLIPDSCCYQPAREGVALPTYLQQQIWGQFQESQLLQFFVNRRGRNPYSPLKIGSNWDKRY